MTMETSQNLHFPIGEAGGAPDVFMHSPSSENGWQWRAPVRVAEAAATPPRVKEKQGKSQLVRTKVWKYMGTYGNIHTCYIYIYKIDIDNGNIWGFP